MSIQPKLSNAASFVGATDMWRAPTEFCVKTWPCKLGSVKLLIDFENVKRVVVEQSGCAYKVDRTWTTGLPENVERFSLEDLLKFLDGTYVKVSSLGFNCFRVEILRGLLGGMLPVSLSKIDKAKEISDCALKAFFHESSPVEPLPLLKKMEERGDRKFKILSLDGGGVRGLIPLKVLLSLEKMMGSLDGIFDLICGTSTGGIIALGLTTPFKKNKVEDFLEIYRNPAKVFVHNKDNPAYSIARNLIGSKGAGKLRNLLTERPLYNSYGLEETARTYMGESMMHESKTGILVSTVDVTDKRKPFAKSFTNIDREFYTLAMQDVARATSAAPLYFPQVTIRGRKYVDGGVCYNNPSMLGHLHAINNNVAPSAEYIVSLGTGFSDVEGIGEDKHGLMFWARSIYPVFSVASSNAIDCDLKSMLSDRYHRISPHMSNEIELDDCSDGSIRELEELGDKLVEDMEGEIRKIVKDLQPDAI